MLFRKEQPEQTLTSTTSRSSLFLLLRKVAANIIQLGAIAILARKLDPADFGLVALATLALQFISTMGAGGIDQYIIYDNDDGRDARVSAAFWLNFLLSAVMICLILLALPFTAKFFEQPSILKIGIVLGGTFFFDQLGSVPKALLKKELNFKTLVTFDTIFHFATSLLSVLSAIAGFGVWSLVVPSLIMAPVRTTSFYFLARWCPKFYFDIGDLKTVFSYSKNIMGTSILGFVINQGDALLIGKLLNSRSLGIYNQAWNFSNFATKNILGVANQLAMPAFTLVSNELNRFQSGYLRMIKLLCLTCFPLLIGMFVLAEELIMTIYGQKWIDVILPLRILLFFTIIRSFTSPVGSVFNAVGRPDIGFKWNLLFTPFYIIAIYVGTRWGIVGVAASVTLVRSLGAFVVLKKAGKLIDLSFYLIIKQTFSAFVSGLIMGFLIYVLKPYLSLIAESDMGILGLEILLGCIIYLGILLILFKKDLFYLIEIGELIFPSIRKWDLRSILDDKRKWVES